MSAEHQRAAARRRWHLSRGAVYISQASPPGP